MPKWVVFPATTDMIRRVVSAGLLTAALTLLAAPLPAQTLPPAFRDKVIFTGLTQPTAVAFASDGRVFVAEKSGLIKVFASLSATTPTVFADLRTEVYNYWDRGLLGLALHPDFPATPYVYVVYTYDALIGGTPARWGPGDGTSDPCPTPPGATSDGCTVSGRLSRLQASGSVMTGTEQVLVEDWFQQFPSHSIGTVLFGNDGALYASGGDGASFNFTDYGQTGNPLNPGGDPPVGVGGVQTPPTAEGGALRSQDLRTSGDPVGLSGSVIRVDPETGAGLPDNPLAADPDPNARRIIAEGLRNPFRFTSRPGTNEIWIGDVGWATWEEINRIQTPTTFTNFGWPCYEGTGHQQSYENLGLDICTDLYAQGAGAVRGPYYSYNHSVSIVPGESCSTGSSSITGLAFYTANSYPASYQNALFFADYSRNCVWVMLPGGSGDPDPSNIQTFDAGSATPVQLVTGPGGDVFYVDINGGKIHRIQYFLPTAAFTASVTSGSAPLTVTFDGSGSTDPDPTDTLSYSWDLNGDGTFGDATTAQASYTFVASGNYTVTLRVTDTHGGTDTETVVISVNNAPPVPVIAAPLSTLTWKVGDLINFSGSAVDPQDGQLAASALSWTLLIHHCPSDCHLHTVQSYNGTASGSFNAPDHEYPSYLELKLTANDSTGLQASTSVLLYPQTVTLGLATSPPGLQVSWDVTTAAAPFNATVIVGSQNSLSAPLTQVLGTGSYEFVSWSDAGAASHNVTAPAAPVTYTATFVQQPPLSSVSASPASVVGGTPSTGTVILSGPAPPSGAEVALSSSNVTVASVPSSVTVAAGGSSATFPISTSLVGANTSVTITAFYAAGSVTGTLAVNAPPNHPPSVAITSPAGGANFSAPAAITILATASDTDGTIARVDFYSGVVLLATVTSAPYTYNWTNVAVDNYTLTAVATDNLGASTTSTPVVVNVNPASGAPPPWAEQDIGLLSPAGSTVVTGGTFSVTGAGADIWSTSDQFHFVYQPLSGDGEIVARVPSIQNTNVWAKVGVMIRESLAANSKFVDMLLTPANGVAFQRRATTGASGIGTNVTGPAPPYWVRLVRTGSSFTGFVSADGATWSLVGSATVSMATNVYVGLAVTSHSPGVLCTATFDNITFTPRPPDVPPTVSITSPAAGAVFYAPATIALAATASDSDGTVAKVDFYSGTTLLATVTSAPYTYNWTNVAVGNYSLTAVATDNLGAVTTSTAIAVSVTTPPNLPSPWLDQDIGSPSPAGSASFAGGTFTVKGAGSDIYGTSDQFHFVYQPLSGNGTIVARVPSIQNTNVWAKVGVMIRESLAPNSTFVDMLLTPGSGVSFQRRTATGASGTTSNVTGPAPPYWVQLVRTGTSFTGFVSSDGATWSLVGSTTVSMATNVYVGLAVTSHSPGVLCTATFDNITFTPRPPDVPPTVSITSPAAGAVFYAPATIALAATASDSDGTVAKVDFYSGTTLLATDTSAPYTYNWTNVAVGSYSLTAVATDNLGAVTTSAAVAVSVTTLPSPWLDQDIGSPSPAGSASFAGGTFTDKGAGSDIWYASDQFHFVYQPLSGNGTIVARVPSIQNTNVWAKVGVMIRESLAANSTFADMLLTPASGVAFQRRTATGASATGTTVTGPAPPYWVRLVRAGNIFTGFVSSDGATWSQIGSVTVSMATNVYIGLAVTGHSPGVLCTATFDNVTKSP